MANPAKSHPPRETLKEYLKKALTPKVENKIRTHLDTCYVCRSKLPILEKEIAAGPTRWADTHLTQDEFNDYLHGTLDEQSQRSAEGHYRECELCKASVAKERLKIEKMRDDPIRTVEEIRIINDALMRLAQLEGLSALFDRKEG